METNFSILAWRIPRTEEPGGLQSMGLQSWTRLMKVKEESEKVGLKLNIQKTKIMAFGSHHFMGNRSGNSVILYFLGLQNHWRWWLQPWNKKTWKKSYDQHRQHSKKQRHYFANKGPSGQEYGFSSSHAWMWWLDYKESWVLKNWCFWTVVLGKTLESPLACKQIQSIHPKGDQSWVFIGRNNIEAETPIFWPPDVKSWLIWKDPDVGQDWSWDEKGMTEDEMTEDGWMASLTQRTWMWATSGS